MNRLFGRQVIYTTETEITRDNVLEVLEIALRTHHQNSREISYLYKYYRGNQPILNRQKDIRPEINNKIVENHAMEIVDFKKGYVFGEPVQYVRRGDAEGVSEKITLLNEYMFAEDKSARDQELAEWFYICGTAYRMVLPDSHVGQEMDESPFEIDTLDPRNTFIVYNNGFGKKPVMGVTYVRKDTGETVYSVYTKDTYFEIVDTMLDKEEPHSLGDIPIIEYAANSARMGAFESVLTLLDALNTVASNRLDGIEQFVQSFMKFINCDIDAETFKELKELGAIKIKGEQGAPADVDIVSQELNQTQTQVTKDDLYQTILIICGMPDRKGSGTSSGDTGKAVELRDGWAAAESRAKESELMFKKAERRFLKLALRISRDMEGVDLALKDIDVKFTRNKTDNLLVKTQGLQNMLEAGIAPLIAITHSGLFSDPEQTYLDSIEYLEKWKRAKVTEVPANNKPDPKDGDGE